MRRLATTTAAIAATTAVMTALATPAAAYDGAVFSAHQETDPFLPCQAVNTSVPVGGARVDGVEVCFPQLDVETFLPVPFASPAGAEAYTPFAQVVLDPVVVRVYVNDGVEEIGYPAAAATFRTPPPVCLHDDYHAPGTDCLA